jgi:hypothetical protein
MAARLEEDSGSAKLSLEPSRAMDASGVVGDICDALAKEGRHLLG